MNPEIEQRIREVYACGRLEYVNETACNFVAAEKAATALRACLPLVDACISSFWCAASLERVMSAQITLQSASRELWDAMDADAQLQYLHSLEGTPWVQCCINISTVYPAYELYFNLMYPAAPDANPADGVFRTECPRHYDAAPWPEVVAAIHAACQSAGFSELPEDVLQADVPFVTEADWGFGEGDDLEEDDLPRDVCNVAQCLFQAW